MKKQRGVAPQFAVCTNNEGYEASLEFGKLYRVVPDAKADEHGYVTIIDESGEGYWYSSQRFFCLKVPAELARTLEAGT